MPIESVPKTELKYYLLCFDTRLRERTDDPDGNLAQQVVDVVRDEPITDVFLMTHGWMGDVPAARLQCNNWIGAMAAQTADMERARAQRPGFKPLLIGLHWPSLPFGNEELGGGDGVSFAAPGAGPDPTAGNQVTPEQLLEDYADRTAATPAARAALQTIFAAAFDNVAPDEMPEEVREAYLVLDREAELGSDGAAGAPDADRDPFDPEAIFRAAEDEMVSFGGFSLGGLLAPLRTLSFWRMKDRGRRFGETCVLPLVNRLQDAVPAGRDVRFHLMGHSFGCVVMSAALAGGQGGSLRRPVHSAALLQGALSLWSFADSIPAAAGRAGYFHAAITKRPVVGPIITSQSEHDTAVGRWYPLAAGVARQVNFAPGELPKYGAVGTFGIRGTEVQDREMLAADGAYQFEPGKIYNLESSQYIRHGSGPEGAHNDIANPEVTHAFWEAVLTE